MPISVDSIVSDIRSLGVSPGDTLFVRANFGAIGRVKGGRNVILDALLETVGPDGTLVTLAYTKSFLFRPPKDYIFTAETESYAGALPNTMLKHPRALRSKHPTNSIVAIGAKARSIVDGHDEHSRAYEPIRKLVELNAKMMLIGIADSSPGFTTAHLAEQDLKMYRRVIFPKLYGAYYLDKNDNVSLFRRKDVGLCSSSYRKFYSYYVDNEILLSGRVGKAYSILVEAEPAYQIEKAILKKNPRFNV